jgi:hypothetical protein
VGAALRAARGPGDSQTALAPTAAGSALDAMTLADIPRESASAPALAWSEAGDDSGIMPIRPGEYDDEPASGAVAPLRARPRRDLAPEPVITGASGDAWYRRPLVVAIGTALAVLAIGAGVLIAIRHTSSAPSTPAPSVSTPPAPPTSADVSDTHAPTSNPPSSTAPDTSTAPSTTSETPTTTTTSQPPTTTTQGAQRPDRPRFPREPGGRLVPEPGGR